MPDEPVGNVAYCTDTNAVPADSMELLRGLDVLILDALRHKGHSTHLSIDEAVEMAKKFSGSEAPGFVNGILGAVDREMKAEAS